MNTGSMQKQMYVLVLLFLLLPCNAFSEGAIMHKVSAENGNIFFSSGTVKKQLTTTGQDSAPILSLDGKTVIFIRRSNEMAYNPIEGADNPRDPHADQIWSVSIDGRSERMLVRDKNPDKSNPKNWRGEDVIGFIEDDSLQFSPDGKTIYFLIPAWVTSSALHAVNMDGSNEHFIAAANTLKVIDKGQYRGDLIVSQHRYFLAGGSYDWYYVFTPEGKEIGPLGENLKDIDWDFLYSSASK